MQPVSSNPFDLFTVATVRISVYHITLGGSPFFATMLIHSPNVTVRDCLTCSTSRQLSSQGRDIPNGDKHTSFVFRKTDSSPGKRYLHCRQLQVRLRLVSQTLLKILVPAHPQAESGGHVLVVTVTGNIGPCCPSPCTSTSTRASGNYERSKLLRSAASTQLERTDSDQEMKPLSCSRFCEVLTVTDRGRLYPSPR